MARLNRIFVATEGRDAGKRYLITEMPASQGEWWALEAFFAMAAAGVEISDEVARTGLVGIVNLGFNALGKIPLEKAKPLIDKLMSCVAFLPDPNNNDVVRALVESDCEEIMTRIQLKRMALSIHTDFFTGGGR